MMSSLAVSIDALADADVSDDSLLAAIQAHSRLPERKQRRYLQLRRKCDAEMLSPRELTEYKELVRQLEVLNVKRIETLSILAQRRGKTVRDVVAEFGLGAEHDAC